MLRGAGLLALAILLVSASAFADETATFREQVQLDYRVPSGCPDESAFLAVVTARTHRAKFVEDDSASRRLLVDIRRRGSNYEGRLVIERLSASEGFARGATRELTGARCADLVRAFGLFTALAIDPGADGELRQTPSSYTPLDQVRPPPSRPSSESTPADSPAEYETESSRPLPPKKNSKRTLAPLKGERSATRVWHGAWGSGVFVAGGVAQSPLVAAHPVFEIASKGPLFSPSVQVGLVWANGASQSADTVELAIGLRMLVLSGCAVRFSPVDTIDLRLCVAFEGGISTVQPFGIVRPKALVTPWVALSPLVRLDVPILPSLLTLELHAGVAVPFQRLQGYVDPGLVISEIGTVGGRIGADVLLRAF